LTFQNEFFILKSSFEWKKNRTAQQELFMFFPTFCLWLLPKQKDHFKEQIKAVGKRVTGDSDRFLF